MKTLTLFGVLCMSALTTLAAPTALPAPHFQSARITHVDIVDVQPGIITYYWHDGTQRLGSPVTITRVAPPAAEGEEAAILDPMAAIAAHLAAEQAKVAVVPVPQEVTRRQLFLVVNSELGLTRDQLRAGITTEAGLIEFDEALTFRRNHPLIATLGAQLGLTSEQIDNLFIAAAQL